MTFLRWNMLFLNGSSEEVWMGLVMMLSVLLRFLLVEEWGEEPGEGEGEGLGRGGWGRVATSASGNVSSENTAGRV